MTGDAAILALKYAEGSTGPETIVLKYAKDLEANRVLAQEANMYDHTTFSKSVGKIVRRVQYMLYSRR